MYPFIQLRKFSIFVISLAIGVSHLHSDETEAFSWDDMDKLRQSIVVPTFQNREFLVTDFGAAADGRTDCTDAFSKAIEACAKAGGGRVIVRGGVFRTGPIHLKSNVNLHVAEGTTLSFYTDPARFLPAVLTRYEGVEVMNYSPLIYAYGETNIAITGSGTLDGGADDSNWWKMIPPKISQLDKDPTHTKVLLFEMAEKGIPVSERVFGLSSRLRPTFIEPYACENVLIENVTLVNAPFWMIHPVVCKNVTVRGVTCSSTGPNNDGCDPESSENVLIENCVFNTKDDGVAIKAGRNADGRRVNKPTRNIIISNCVMNTKHTAIAIGSEMTGGVENVYVENLTCSNIQRVFRIKTNSMRGGYVRHVGLRNSSIDEATGTLIDFKTNYGKETGPFFPEVEDIVIQGIQCKKSEQAISFNGTENMPIRRVQLENIRVRKTRKASLFNHVQGLITDGIEIGSASFSGSVDDKINQR